MNRSVWVDDWIATIAPDRCAWCGQPAGGAGICGGCRDDLPWNRVHCPGCALPQIAPVLCRRCQRRAHRFDSAWTPFVLVQPVQQAIHRLKYGARFGPARSLGRLMAQQLARRPEPLPDLVIPVPLHRQRQFQRGYNQARELARGLAGVLAIEVDEQAVSRTRATPDQIGLNAAARRRNLRGAFAVTRDLSGLHVALLDDVLTTGATLDELARAVRAAGASRIEAWALARAP
ncbi:MAG: ComF family protein [Panacagrimonas sp.]